MNYAYRIEKELVAMVWEHRHDKIISKANLRKIHRLNNLRRLSLGLKPRTWEWSKWYFAGRPNRTPWRMRNMKYISKAKRLAFAEMVR